jgi:alkanesulfonate monooxygenase SsuD/methylene tetrahydromethanopterin reductase-like flavin-dependent oxidoreductase (luciferase family)
MAAVTTVGAVVLPALPPERYLPVARAADEAGLAELWLWEDCFAESGLGAAAALLGATDRIRVGIGVLPVPLRNVAVTAMEVATLERMFPGRLILGIGHGVQDWMGQVGARPRSVLTLLREYATALRSLLDGEEVTTDGEYVRLDRVRLTWPPAGRVPLYAGVTGDRSLRLAGEVADGTILVAGTTPTGVTRARRLIEEGVPEGGERHRIVQYLSSATGPDAAERTARHRGTNDSGANASGTEESGPEESVAVGDAAAVAAVVGRYAAAGADTVVLEPTPDDPDPEGFVRFAAEVAALAP